MLLSKSFKCACTVVKTQAPVGVSLVSLKVLEEEAAIRILQMWLYMVKTQGWGRVPLKALEEESVIKITEFGFCDCQDTRVG